MGDWDRMQAGVEAEREKQKLVTLGKINDANQRALLREYADAGVDPIYGADGTLCSLSLYRSLGYTINEVGGERVLVAPVKVDQL